MFKCLNPHVYGQYSFDGKCLPSAQVYTHLSMKEIKQIAKEVKRITSEHDVDCVLILENEQNQRILAIDNISKADKQALKEAGYAKDIPGHDYYTLAFDTL